MIKLIVTSEEGLKPGQCEHLHFSLTLPINSNRQVSGSPKHDAARQMHKRKARSYDFPLTEI